MTKDLVSVALIVAVVLGQCLSVVHGVARRTPDSPQEYLDRHNEARAEVGVGPLRWSEQVAHEASLVVRQQRDNQGCNFANLSDEKYGGNQFWEGGGRMTPRMAVETWVEEKKYYNHSTNSCSPPNQPCGTYTQVVWSRSLELGCARAMCSRNITATLTICFYNPPGNIGGETPY